MSDYECLIVRIFHKINFFVKKMNPQPEQKVEFGGSFLSVSREFSLSITFKCISKVKIQYLHYF